MLWKSPCFKFDRSNCWALLPGKTMKWLVCQIWTTRFRVKPASTQGPNTHVGFMTSPTRRFSGTQRSDGSSVRVNWNCLLNSILSAQNFFCWLIHLSWLKLHSCWLNHVDSTLLLIKCELFLSRTFPGLDGWQMYTEKRNFEVKSWFRSVSSLQKKTNQPYQLYGWLPLHFCRWRKLGVPLGSWARQSAILDIRNLTLLFFSMFLSYLFLKHIDTLLYIIYILNI